jgi:hypothetical protein
MQSYGDFVTLDDPVFFCLDDSYELRCVEDIFSKRAVVLNIHI